MTSDRLSQGMLSEADQRAAGARDFIQRMLADPWLRSRAAKVAGVDSVDIAVLSAGLDTILTDYRELADVAAMAIYRLAAR